jgi:hypothetical protein
LNEKRGMHAQFLVRKPEGKKQLGRPRLRWVDNKKIIVRKMCWGEMDWNYVVHDTNL